MLLEKDSNPALNTVTAYGDDYVEINEERFHSAICFTPEGPIQSMELQRASDITAELLKKLLNLTEAAQDPMAFLDDAPATLERPDDAPEVVLIGTGLSQHFLPAPTIQPLLDVGIGVETMSTHAAARTFNILMSEERRVLALLILGDE